MHDMINSEDAWAGREIAATAAPPLAGLDCCKNIPEYYGSTAPSAEPELRAGQVLDDQFLVREVFSRGGMATIYRAEDLRNDWRAVALKVPLMRVESDPAWFARFHHEEETGLTLSHPFVLKFFPSRGRNAARISLPNSCGVARSTASATRRVHLWKAMR